MDFADATTLVASLRNGTVSALELFYRAIDRIQRHDGALNAVVVRDFERARAAALAADAALARGDRRPLLGVPMTVKESFNVAGLPTTWGIPGTSGKLAASDAVAVSRLRSAGAVILGKTNVPTNLEDFQSVNPVYGWTRNPWNLERTPGGSSGGAAAALAAGLVALELGSDMAGSLRVPAHCCGVFAHKPSFGLVPMRGHTPPGVLEFPVRPHSDIGVAGPMARSAADLMLALEVLAGPDEPESIAYRLELPPARHSRLSEYKVLVLDDHPFLPLSDEVRDGLGRFVDKLRHAGCRVEQSSPLLPDLSRTGDVFIRLLRALLGGYLPGTEYDRQREQVAHLSGRHDTEAMRLRALVATHRDWMVADQARAALAHEWREMFRVWDVVVCPVLPITAFPNDESPMGERSIDIDDMCVPYGLLGAWSAPASSLNLPSTVMPIGVGSSGLPIGVQVIGPYLEDRSTIGFAELAEREFGGYVPPPAYTN